LTGTYLQPTELDEALAALAAGPLTILSGGTDLYPAHVERPLPPALLDISRIAALRGIVRMADGWRIGALTSWSSVGKADLPRGFDGLRNAAREVGSQQVQNRGTIAGNLCNASPAADGVPPLMCLDASVEIASLTGRRVLPLTEFLTGYRATALLPGEMVTAVLIPHGLTQGGSAFVKLGARSYLVISIVMAAANLLRDETGRITAARVAVGAASAVAKRLPLLEAALLALPAGSKPSAALRHEHLAALTPIDDVRASATYRTDAAMALVAEALDTAGANHG
jgi:CO/xanthine dehydrogenase FAD-binding subunit